MRTQFVKVAAAAAVIFVAARGEIGLANCDEGKASFAGSMHQLVYNNCTGCHSERGPGPAFAVPDVAASYARILNYTNFADMGNSYIAVKGGNGHCGCGMTRETIAAQIQAWWDGGENSCPSTSRFVTESIAVPELPTRDEGFNMLEWDLSYISTSFRGVKFTIEAQKFNEPKARGAYRFRNPRISAAPNTVAVSGIDIQINGVPGASSQPYHSVDAVVTPVGDRSSNPNVPSPPLALLSAEHLIIAQQRVVGDYISVGFAGLSFAEPLACSQTAMFEENVMPTLRARNCFACHAGNGETGAAPANYRFSMNLSTDKLCAAFLQRIHKADPDMSVAIIYPTGTNANHPQVFTPQDLVAVRESWRSWMETEIADRN